MSLSHIKSQHFFEIFKFGMESKLSTSTYSPLPPVRPGGTPSGHATFAVPARGSSAEVGAGASGTAVGTGGAADNCPA